MGRSVGPLCAWTVLAIFGACATPNAKTPSVEQGLKEEAAAAVKDLPNKISQDMTLIHVVPAGRSILYGYVIHQDYAFLEATLVKIRENARTDKIKALCAEQNTRSLLNRGATYAYIYDSQDLKYLFAYEVTKLDCATIGRHRRDDGPARPYPSKVETLSVENRLKMLADLSAKEEGSIRNVAAGRSIFVRYVMRRDYTNFPLILGSLETSLRIGAIKRVCGGQEVKSLLNRGAVFGYTYNSQDLKYLFAYEVTKSDCNQPLSVQGELKMLAAVTSKYLPKKLNGTTSVAVDVEGQVFSYLSLINHDYAVLQPKLDSLKTRFRIDSIIGLCGMLSREKPLERGLLDGGAEFKYSYRSQDDKGLFDYKVTKSDCSGPLPTPSAEAFEKTMKDLDKTMKDLEKGPK